jgi:hypothetical protein
MSNTPFIPAQIRREAFEHGSNLSGKTDLSWVSSQRYSTLVTSNRAVGEWGTVFGDPVVATAILDRLLHHSHVVTIRGDSYRLREKRRSGLLQKSTPARQTEAA